MTRTAAGRAAGLRRRRHRRSSGCSHEQADDLAARIGAPLELVGVAVRRRPRAPPTSPAELLTTDAAGLVARDDVDLVVEVIGGIEPARTLLLAALRAARAWSPPTRRCSPRTARRCTTPPAEAGVDLYFEAAVAGAIPLLRPLRESLAGDRITRVIGIVNGTTNFILSRMDATGAGFAEALAEATALGYAEADPTADIEGFDAAAKAAILAGLAFHTRVTAADVYREGIAEVTAADMASAAAMGCTVKLLAICERDPTPTARRRVAVRVHPAMIPRTHPLAGVGDAFNAVFVEAEAAGQLMFYGRGAGGAPTASAVLGDLVAVARNRLAGAARAGRDRPTPSCRSSPMGEVLTRYHVSLDVADQARRAGRRRQRLRRARREHPDRAAGGPRRRRHAGPRHPHRPGRGAGRDRRRAAASWTRPRPSPACMRVEGVTWSTSDRRSHRPWPGRDRGVPRPAAGHRGDAGRHPARGRHAAAARAASCPRRTGCEVYLKVEGANPTGSFKDRGMTVAISKAVEEGAKAVICASTGNTSASAAAYAVRAGMTCAVLVPAGQDRARQAGPGARARRKLLQVDGNFDDCLALARKLADRLPGGAGQLASTRTGSRARRPRRSRSATRSATRPTCTACRSATPATSPPTGGATASTPPTASRRATPRDVRLPGRRRGADRERRTGRREPEDHRHRDPDRQPGVVDQGAGTPATSPAA